MATPQPDAARLVHYTARGLGLAHVLTGLAAQIVHVVERMHGTIQRAPLPVGRIENDRTAGITGLVYRSLHGSFAGIDAGLAALARQLADDESAPDDPAWIRTLAILNGVFGDTLAERDSPLALNMRLLAPASERPLLLFIHGLCLSDLAWQGPGHREFADWARAQWGADIGYLRYNSGRPIPDNGRELADLLERAADRPLIVIGHSMGGLIVRSALAQSEGMRWPAQLRHLAMLGSPHHGAPLERAGNGLNRTLKRSPYVKPFTQLGDLRSAGIQDLRHGNVRPEDRSARPDPDWPHDPRQIKPLPAGPRYLALAASRSPELPAAVWQARDDYLVPVASALGLSRQPAKALDHPQLTRRVLPGIDHFDLLSAGPVYASLREWLTGETPSRRG